MTTRRMLTIERAQVVAAAFGLLALPAIAMDFSWSGFGTLGYARSDSDYVYERFVSEAGSLKRDSVFGLQATLEVGPRVSMAAQAVIEPSTQDDHKIDVSLPWAYVAYRPNNEWLLRVGRMRMPMYLYSENMNVGGSFELMHLPTEVYSTAPTTEYSGASFVRTWDVGAGELALDGYLGITRLATRTLDNTSPGSSATLRTRSGGMMLTYRQNDDVYRTGLQQAFIAVPKGNLASVPGGATPPAGSSAPAEAMDNWSGDIDTRVFLLGVDKALAHNYRLVAEVARRHAGNLETPKNSWGGYLAVLRRSGPWSPYVLVGRLLSDASSRRATPGFQNDFDDQVARALGTSYALSPRSRVKAEWMRVEFGGGSTLVDRPKMGPAISHRHINLLSASYSFVF